jgi:uncharacterized membrane protein YgcG
VIIVIIAFMVMVVMLAMMIVSVVSTLMPATFLMVTSAKCTCGALARCACRSAPERGGGAGFGKGWRGCRQSSKANGGAEGRRGEGSGDPGDFYHRHGFLLAAPAFRGKKKKGTAA